MASASAPRTTSPSGRVTLNASALGLNSLGEAGGRVNSANLTDAPDLIGPAAVPCSLRSYTQVVKV